MHAFRVLLTLLMLAGGTGTALAGSSTPNHNLYKPALNETGWGALVNGNWDTLDNVPTISGVITAGNCAKWISSVTIGDAGSPCGAGGGSSGITSLNAQTGATQVFGNDTNVTISSSGGVHTITWAGILATSRGGTGVSDFTFSGTTHKALTLSGALTSGNCLQSDVNGNAVDAGTTCGGGGGGGMAIGAAVTSGTAGSVLYVGAGPVLSQANVSGLILGNGSSAPSAYGGSSCTNQVIRVLSAAGSATCVSITDAFLSGAVAVTHGGTGLTSIATNQVWIATGANTVAAVTIPSCANSTTSKLLYDNTTQTFSCGTDQNSSSNYTVATKTTNYTITTSDKVIRCDATTGTVTLTLPASTASGIFYLVKKVDSSANLCTITRAGADTVDGATTYSLVRQYDSITVIDDASGKYELF